MSKVLNNFLIGIGFQFDNKGKTEAINSLNNIKTTALQAGASIKKRFSDLKFPFKPIAKFGAALAGVFAGKRLTLDYEHYINTIARISAVLGVSANNVQAYGRAFQQQGGTVSSFLNQLQHIEELRAKLKTGKPGFISEAGRAGLDVHSLINAKNAIQAYLSVANSFKKATVDQRLNFASSLGLDNASIRFLSLGSDKIEKLVDHQKQLRVITKEDVKNSKEFHNNLVDSKAVLLNMADIVSREVMPPINKLIHSVNSVASGNSFTDFVKKHKEGIGIGIGALATVALGGAGLLLRTLPIIGRLGPLLTVASKVGQSGVIGKIAYDSITKDPIIDKTIAIGQAEKLKNEKQQKLFYDQFNSKEAVELRSKFKKNLLTNNYIQNSPFSTLSYPQQQKIVLTLDGKVISEHMLEVMGQHNKIAVDSLHK